MSLNEGRLENKTGQSVNGKFHVLELGWTGSRWVCVVW